MKTTNMLMALLTVVMVGVLMFSGCNKAIGGPVSASLDWEWTAPGDDGTDGQASQYDFRYTTVAGELTSNWAGCTPLLNLPAPSMAGSPEVYATTITLQTGVTYYFAIMTADEVPNWSGVSNIVTVFIPDGISPSNVTDLDVTVTIN